jgi:hypothetical protein
MEIVAAVITWRIFPAPGSDQVPATTDVAAIAGYEHA